MEQVRTIKLYGPLSGEFGHVHHRAVSNVGEAIRAMCVTIPGFERFMMNAQDRGLVFAVHVGRKNVGEDELLNPVGSDEIRIVALPAGSKKAGVLQVVAGVVLIAVGMMVQAWGFGGAPNPISKYLYGAGISMIVGGVVQMLAPPPKISQDDKERLTSYHFNGAVNVQSHGANVPVLYGDMFAGSVVVSGGISVEDNYVTPTTGGGGGDDIYRDGDSFTGTIDERYEQ